MYPQHRRYNQIYPRLHSNPHYIVYGSFRRNKSIRLHSLHMLILSNIYPRCYRRYSWPIRPLSKSPKHTPHKQKLLLLNKCSRHSWYKN